jgi:nonspecific dipeptidase
MANVEIPKDLQSIFGYIDVNQRKFIGALGEAVAIKSVSAWEKIDEIDHMAEWVAERLRALGATTEIVDLPNRQNSNGEEIRTPKVLFGSLKATNPSGKKTVLIYGHLDVQPALKEDGWDTEPFVMTEINGKLFGRGSTDDKGPVLGWLHAIEAFQKQNVEIPVNIKFVFEGLEEVGSFGLGELLYSRQTDFIKDIDFVCVSDNYWLGKEKPCLTYGLRGIIYYNLEIECATKDLHSGVFGGSVPEAMTDVIYMMSKLVDRHGKILVPGIMEDVAEITTNELDLYKNISFDPECFREDIGSNCLLHQDKTNLLMHRWRYPSLSLHGIEGAFYEQGAKTVIPRKVIGKFSIRIVPNQDPNKVIEKVHDYVNVLWREYGSPNTMKITNGLPGSAWTEDPDHPNYQAARTATKYVYKIEPDMTREGGSIPVVLDIQRATNTNVCLLPMGACDDGAHSQNEKIDVRNYIEGTKVFAGYLYELGRV